MLSARAARLAQAARDSGETRYRTRSSWPGRSASQAKETQSASDGRAATSRTRKRRGRTKQDEGQEVPVRCGQLNDHRHEDDEL